MVWRKGDEELKVSEKIHMASVGHKHMLTVRKSEMTDQSEYTIVVEEGVESTAQLTVEGRVQLIKIFVLPVFILAC